MINTKLFSILPDYICTPDGMEIDHDGTLILSCPNFANEKMSGCVVKIDKDGNVKKWFDVPVHPETKVARNMGIALDYEGNIYLCDNQGWSEKESVLYKGRILKLTVDDKGNILKTIVVAKNMEHPNGIRIHDGYMYVTQSYMHPVKREDGSLVSCIYRFDLNDEEINITNTLKDRNIFTTFVTNNPECQYGVDGIAFDKNGNLFVGNFGDGEIYKITFNEDKSLKSKELFAKNETELKSTDGMCFDKENNLYIADFCANAIVKVTPDGVVKRLAQSEDCTGVDGGLDQPGETIIWNDKIIASCFDLVTGPGKVNLKHELPATLVELKL